LKEPLLPTGQLILFVLSLTLVTGWPTATARRAQLFYWA